MADVAKLGIQVDARQVKQAALELLGLERSGSRAERSARSLERQMFNLKNALRALGVGLVVREVAQAQIAFERINNSLTAATGSAKLASDAYRFVREEALRLGLNLETAARNFAQIAAASRGTALEGAKAREVFSAVAEAARVMGLSNEQLSGTLVAVNQIIGKGVVSMEELRQQLGDRIPGAAQIAARAMGVTVQELFKMVEQGEVLSDEFLPKFARELRNTFGAGLPDAVNSAQAQIERFNTALFELKVEFAQSGFLDALIDNMTKLTAVMGSSDFQQATRALGENLGSAIVAITDNFEQLTKAFATFYGALRGARLGAFFGPFGAIIGGLVGGLGSLVAVTELFFDEADRLNGVIENSVSLDRELLDLRKQLADATGDETVAIKDKIEALEEESQRQLDLLRGERARLTAKQGQFLSLAGDDIPDTPAYRALLGQIHELDDAIRRLSGGLTIAEEAQLRAASAAGTLVVAVERAGDASDKASDKVLDVVEALQNEVDALHKTELQREIDNNLRKAGIERTHILGTEIERLTRIIYQDAKAHEALDQIVEGAYESLARMADEAERAGAAIIADQEQRQALKDASGEIEFQNVLLMNRLNGQEQMNALLIAERDIRAQFPGATEEQIQKLVEQRRLQGDLTARVEQHEREVQNLQRAYDQLARNIQNELADAFYNVLDDAEDGFDQFFDNLIDLAKKSAAQIAAAMVIQPVLGGIGSTFGLVAPQSGTVATTLLGSLFGGGGASGGGGLLGGLLGGGNSPVSALTNVLPTGQIFDALGLGSLFGGGGLTALGPGGATASSLGVAAVPGGASNAAVAAGLGPALAGIGGLLGIASIAAMGYSATSGHDPQPRGAARVGLDEFGDLRVQQVFTDDNGSDEAAKQIGDTLQTILASFAASTGGTFAEGFDARVGFKASIGAYDSFVGGVDDPNGFLVGAYGGRVQNDTLFHGIDDAYKRIIAVSVQEGLIDGVDQADVDIILREGIEEGLRLLQLKALFREDVADPIETVLREAIDALKPAFEQMVEDAKKAGIDLVKVEAALTKDRIAIIRQASEEEIRAFLDSLADPAGRELLAQYESEAELARRDAIEAINGEILANQELARTIQGTAQDLYDASEAFAELRDELLLSNLSPLTPEQKLAEARSQLDQQVALGRSGDIDAIDALPDAITSFLEASRGFNASSSAYRSDFDYAQALLDEFEGLTVSQAEGVNEQLAALTGQNQLLADMAAALSEPEGPNADLLKDQIEELAAMGVQNEALNSSLQSIFTIAEQIATVLDEINAANQQANEAAAAANEAANPDAQADIQPEYFPTRQEQFAEFLLEQARMRGDFSPLSVGYGQGVDWERLNREQAQGYSTGGLVMGPMGDDVIPARLTRGEFVFNTQAVNDMGVGTLEAINSGRGFGGIERRLDVIAERLGSVEQTIGLGTAVLVDEERESRQALTNMRPVNDARAPKRRAV